jgi:hypothetical protein
MKHTATQALVTIAIALAIVVAVKVIQARAATQPFPAEMLGSWCRFDVIKDGEVESFVRDSNCSDDQRMVINANGYKGFGGVSCQFTHKTQYPASAKFLAAYRFEARCSYAGLTSYVCWGKIGVRHDDTLILESDGER